jgi:hypothetical protein
MSLGKSPWASVVITQRVHGPVTLKRTSSEASHLERPMPWFGVLPPSEHYSLDYVHYSLLGNPVTVRIPAGCLKLGNHERSTRYQPHLA